MLLFGDSDVHKLDKGPGGPFLHQSLDSRSDSKLKNTSNALVIYKMVESYAEVNLTNAALPISAAARAA